MPDRPLSSSSTLDVDIERVAALFAGFAETVARDLPLYRRLAEGVADDPDVAALLLQAPREQQSVPVLLLAAVHDVLLAGDLDQVVRATAGVDAGSCGADEVDEPARRGVDPAGHDRATGRADSAATGSADLAGPTGSCGPGDPARSGDPAGSGEGAGSGDGAGSALPAASVGRGLDRAVIAAGEQLRSWYGSITDPPRPVGSGSDDPWPHFRRLALDHPGVVERLRTRSVQTNEVGRCGPLLLALAEIAADAPGVPPGGGRPLGLVELGASAGLNLLLDGYGYRFGYEARHAHAGPVGSDEPAVGAGPGSRRVQQPEARGAGSVPEGGHDDGGDVDVELHPDAGLVLTCRLRGPVEVPLPERAPTIASRVGIDLHPVDLTDPDRARWLVACQWPDEPDRVHRLRSAMALARSDPPRLVAGDLVERATGLIDEVPAHALPVVVATWVLAYLPDDRQQALLEVLDRAGAARDLTFVYAEGPAWITGLPLPPRPDGAPDGPATALVRIDWRDGERRAVRLADQHPHGRWLEWLQP